MPPLIVKIILLINSFFGVFEKLYCVAVKGIGPGDSLGGAQHLGICKPTWGALLLTSVPFSHHFYHGNKNNVFLPEVLGGRSQVMKVALRTASGGFLKILLFLLQPLCACLLDCGHLRRKSVPFTSQSPVLNRVPGAQHMFNKCLLE